jgi:hypothetical protein
LREAALVEAQSWGLNPQDNHEELIEVVKLRVTNNLGVTFPMFWWILACLPSLDPPGLVHGRQCPRGGGHHLGVPAGGLCL